MANKIFSPTWANATFTDFLPPDLSIIEKMSSDAQTRADKYLDEYNSQVKNLLDEDVHNNFFDLNQQFNNELQGLLEKTKGRQLSDPTTQRDLTSGINKIVTNPEYKNMLRTTKQVQAYEDWINKNKTDVWNDPNYQDYQAFKEGRKNTFQFKPVYENVDVYNDYVAKAASVMLPEVKETIEKYGIAGLMNKSVTDKSAKYILDKFNAAKQGILEIPKVREELLRRSKHTGVSVDDMLNNMFKTAASIHSSTKEEKKVSENPDAGYLQRERQLNMQQQELDFNMGKGDNNNMYFIPKNTGKTYTDGYGNVRTPYTVSETSKYGKKMANDINNITSQEGRKMELSHESLKDENGDLIKTSIQNATNVWNGSVFIENGKAYANINTYVTKKDFKNEDDFNKFKKLPGVVEYNGTEANLNTKGVKSKPFNSKDVVLMIEGTVPILDERIKKGILNSQDGIIRNNQPLQTNQPVQNNSKNQVVEKPMDALNALIKDKEKK